jgi:enoyl-CoA hydratase/carnithine racemase
MADLTSFRPQHFLLDVKERIATVRLDRPDRKNPLTFDSYAELRDFFRALPYEDEDRCGDLCPERRKFLLGRRCA